MTQSQTWNRMNPNVSNPNFHSESIRNQIDLNRIFKPTESWYGLTWIQNRIEILLWVRIGSEWILIQNFGYHLLKFDDARTLSVVPLKFGSYIFELNLKHFLLIPTFCKLNPLKFIIQMSKTCVTTLWNLSLESVLVKFLSFVTGAIRLALMNSEVDY